MNVRCCRCGSFASSTMTYDYAARRVWIADVATPAPIGWYPLCERHADRFTAPVDWTLTDRRLTAPELPFRREVA